jgi:hypothetical protein
MKHYYCIGGDSSCGFNGKSSAGRKILKTCAVDDYCIIRGKGLSRHNGWDIQKVFSVKKDVAPDDGV